MPERLIEERFDKLGKQVQKATDEVAADRVARTAAKQADDRKKFWLILAVAASLFVAVGAVIVAVGASSAAGKAQDAITAVEEQRATSRVSSCDQAVDFAQAHNELVARSQDLLRAIAAITSNPDTQAFIAEQVALYDGNIVRVRDCSAAGLQSFADGTGGYLP